MNQTYEDCSKYDKEFVNIGLNGFASFSKGAQAITTEITDYTQTKLRGRRLLLRGAARREVVRQDVDIQTNYTKLAYEGFIAATTKLGELFSSVISIPN